MRPHVDRLLALFPIQESSARPPDHVVDVEGNAKGKLQS